jgi:hypothetical protein
MAASKAEVAELKEAADGMAAQAALPAGVDRAKVDIVLFRIGRTYAIR